MVAIFIFALSKLTLLLSWVWIVSVQESAVPAPAVFVGLIRVGTWVEHETEDPLPVNAVQPIKILIAWALEIDVVVPCSKVMTGAVPAVGAVTVMLPEFAVKLAVISEEAVTSYTLKFACAKPLV